MIYNESMQLPHMDLWSPAFKNGEMIPVKFTCDGDDISMPLSWNGVPGGVKSFALIMDDPPDAPMQVFTHWVLYNIPPPR